MKPKHTKGPWIRKEINIPDLYSNYVYAKVDGTIRKIAENCRAADAQLIASAPEMLEALEGIQLAIKNSSYYETADLVPMMAKIRDVLKKAKEKI